MFQSELTKKLATLALLFGVVAGCKSLEKLGNPTVLKSPDGRFQLTVPAGWREEPQLNDKAEIQAASKPKEMYVIVLIESKDDFPKDMTLDKFTEISKNSMISKATEPESTLPQPLSINGNDARQYELQGTVKNIKIAYLITTIETPSHYHQIITWTLPSKMAENKDTLKQVTESFSEVSATGSGKSSSH